MGQASGLPVVRIRSNVKLILKQRKMTQQQLAWAIGRDRVWLCKLLNHENPNPTIRTALLIAAELQVPVEDLFYLE